MTTQQPVFKFYHYYIPEFYNTILKCNSTRTVKPSSRIWSQQQKRDYIRYISAGLPTRSPIILYKGSDNEYMCIDGLQRINLIREFMNGSIDSCDNEAIEKYQIDLYITNTALTKEVVSLILGEPLTDEKGDTLLFNTNVKTVVANVKTRMPKKQIHEALKTSVWNKYIGAEIGSAKCYCCQQTTITQREFDTGHVVAEINGGETHIDNLRPICRKCNLSMGISNMDDFKRRYFA